jgi:hypothetical protein
MSGQMIIPRNYGGGSHPFAEPPPREDAAFFPRRRKIESQLMLARSTSGLIPRAAHFAKEPSQARLQPDIAVPVEICSLPF